MAEPNETHLIAGEITAAFLKALALMLSCISLLN
jgi:hypothetical protein